MYGQIYCQTKTKYIDLMLDDSIKLQLLQHGEIYFIRRLFRNPKTAV